MFPEFGKILIILGVVIIIMGVLFLFGDKIPFLGKLPGDIIIKKENYTIYIPIATSILISIILSLILFLFRK
jgi:hypothetical protein